MLTAIDILVIAGITTITSLLAGLISYWLFRNRLIRPLTGQLQTIPARIGLEMGKVAEKATENLDIGAIAGQLGGGEGGMEGLSAISGLLGGDSGGIGGLLQLLGGLGGQKTKKSGHSPGK